MLVENYKGVSINKEGVLKALISQLNKDIALSGLNFSFNLNLSLELFLQDLIDWLDLIVVEKQQQFIALLYRIDVLEKRVFNIPDNSINKIAILIVEREFEKVVLKEYFKGKHNNWPNKKSVVIALASSKHKKVELYSSLVFNKSFYAVKKHWYSLVFQGRNDPPYFFASDQALIDFVKSTPGAIAIVEDTKEIPEHLKIRINE